MARLTGIPDATFVALRNVREVALVNYSSLFAPELKLWSLENLRKFHALFVGRFDQGKGSFLAKWQMQLAGADDLIFQLAAELLYAQQFFTSVTGPEMKIENVRAVLNWCSQPPPIPEWAVEGLSYGLAADQSFNRHRPFHLAWLNEYLIHWQELPEATRVALLNNPWGFAQDVRSIQFPRGAYQPMQEAWLFMIFPDNFENISSRANKKQIRDAFADRLRNGPSDNIDFDLQEIRNTLTDEYGQGFHFYRSPIVEQWQKVTAAQQNAEEHLRSQISRQDILDAIVALDRGEPHAFGPSIFYDLLESGRRYPPKAVVGLAARRALGRPLRSDEFSGGQESWAFRLLRDRGFQVVEKEDARNTRALPAVPPPQVWIEDTKSTHGHGGSRWEFGSCLWSPSANEAGSDQYAVMREPKADDLVIHINDGNLVGWSYVSTPYSVTADSPPSPGQWAGRPSYYRIDLRDFREFPRTLPLSEFIRTNRSAIDQEIREDAPKRYLFILYSGKEVRHAQGAYLTRCTPKLYELIRRDIFGKREPTDISTSSATRLPIYSASAFSADSAIPQETIELWLARLRRKQHLIFQGPPGTGKTYVSERLARILASNSYGMIETVQFHPSYGYEDFMQGIRPIVRNGQLTFERMPGKFLEFCNSARSAPDRAPCILIIDEINRANLSRVFGELMYLLEYRDKEIPLAGQKDPFAIPQNAYIIGTMNTADRSIALVDHALRRRFSFIHLSPDYDVLRSHLEKHALAADALIKALRTLNTAIDDRNYEVGISFFLKDGAKLRWTLKDVWEGEIEPYLEEYFYDQPSKLDPLRWKSLSNGILASWHKDQ